VRAGIASQPSPTRHLSKKQMDKIEIYRLFRRERKVARFNLI
jgi:hypothetical protein